MNVHNILKRKDWCGVVHYDYVIVVSYEIISYQQFPAELIWQCVENVVAENDTGAWENHTLLR